MNTSPRSSRNLACPAIERRRAHRHTLEPLALLSLRCTSGLEYLCTIRDISPEGLRVEICCGEDFSSLDFGELLGVTNCTEALASILKARDLRLVWIRGREAGFTFEEPLPLNSTELRQLLEQNHLLPWMQWRTY